MKKLKTPQDVQRRNFLKTVASSGISAATLRASSVGLGLMASRAGMAAGPNGIQRVLFFYVPDGAPPNTYVWNGGSLGTTSAALAPVKDNVIIFEGCTTGGNGHNDAGLGTLGGGQGIANTYDIELENLIGGATPFPALHLGVMSNNDKSIGMRSGVLIDYNDNPLAAFNRMFGGEVDTSGAGVKRYNSLLDHNLAEINALKGKLDQFEKERLDSHLTAIEKMQSNFNSSLEPIEGCSDIDMNVHAWSGDPTNPDDFTSIAKMQCENVALAFKCNLTNIATIHLGNSQAEFGATGFDHKYHGAVHNGDVGAIKYAAFRAYFTEFLAYMIQLLKDTKDENNVSLIETTILIQVTDQGNGDAHSQDNAPFSMAGGTTAMNVGQGMSSVGHDYDLLDTVSAALGVDGQMKQYGSGPASGILK